MKCNSMTWPTVSAVDELFLYLLEYWYLPRTHAYSQVRLDWICFIPKQILLPVRLFQAKMRLCKVQTMGLVLLSYIMIYVWTHTTSSALHIIFYVHASLWWATWVLYLSVRRTVFLSNSCKLFDVNLFQTPCSGACYPHIFSNAIHTPKSLE